MKMNKLFAKFQKYKPIFALPSIYLKVVLFHKIKICKKRKTEANKKKQKEKLTREHESSLFSNIHNHLHRVHSDYENDESFYDVNETFFEI